MRYFTLSLLLLAACSKNTAKIQANEISAIGQLRAISSAQVQYYASTSRYAAELSQLGPTGAMLIPSDLAHGIKNGYRFELSGDGASFRVTAAPEAPGTSGNRAFFTDQSLVLRVADNAEAAGPTAPELK